MQSPAPVILSAKEILGIDNLLGESIIWDWRVEKLVWTDIHGRAVYRWSPNKTNEPERINFDRRVAAIGLASGGDYILALENGFASLDWQAGYMNWLTKIEHRQSDIRLNDGRVAPDGSFVCGGMHEAEDQAPLAKLYRLRSDGSVQTLLPQIHCANAIAWTPEGDKMYFTDMPSRRVDVYQFSSENIKFQRHLLDFSLTSGWPDGADIDAEGSLWVAVWDGGKIVRISPDGELLAEIALPVTNPTCVAFGGSDLGTLFITSARFGLSATQLRREKAAGNIFSVRPGVRGRCANVFQ